MLYEQIKRNRRKTWLLFIVVFLTISALGAGFAYAFGYTKNDDLIRLALLTDFCFTPIIFFQIATGRHAMLKSAGAQLVTEDVMPSLYHIVEDLAMVAKIPMPEVYIVDDPSINAFASGISKNHTAVSVTTGSLKHFNREQLEGVIAHEITHIANRDIRNMTIVIALSSTLSFLQDLFFWTNLGSRDDDDDDSSNAIALIAIVLTRIVMFFLQFAISRSQEYSADAGAVDLTRNPQGLIEALEIIEGIDEPTHIKKEATAPMYFAPVDVKELFSTHPDTDKRIAALKKL